MLLPDKFLNKFSDFFLDFGKSYSTRNKKFALYFLQSDIPIKPERYVALSLTSLIANFVFLSIILMILFFIGHANLLIAPIIALVLSLFIYMQQMNYPRILVAKKIRNIEVNILPALRAMMVQLTAGVTFFDAFKNIGKANYGLISVEFQKAVNQMESGVPAIEALEKVSKNNPSIFFRRAIWQIITGMQVGADITGVLKEIVKSLVQEQVTEIQSYGGKLSPLSMFYMVVAIIFPALAVTFIVIISTFVKALGQNYKMILYAVMAMVILMQIIFLGMIKSGRPPLV
jgi:pilus assembly protein TadC